ncbi:PREDICTED: uncharacterized protein LOC107183303 [Myotis davidii]|uniref:uncharacterized protein LOC107183303 n=1 Tax=Myotis davidii TaxID=225400 RepID=UPI0007673A36|nr:PREDICTED: uncharacterized protein LOC107183303 [Myotis davidii]
MHRNSLLALSRAVLNLQIRCYFLCLNDHPLSFPVGDILSHQDFSKDTPPSSFPTPHPAAPGSCCCPVRCAICGAHSQPFICSIVVSLPFPRVPISQLLPPTPHLHGGPLPLLLPLPRVSSTCHVSSRRGEQNPEPSGGNQGPMQDPRGLRAGRTGSDVPRGAEMGPDPDFSSAITAEPARNRQWVRSDLGSGRCPSRKKRTFLGPPHRPGWGL